MRIYKFINKRCAYYFKGFKLFEREGNLSKAIENFCDNPCDDSAKEVYKAFLYTYRFLGLEEVIEAMHRFEVTAARMIPCQRDHYVHTVNVFLLGVSIFVCNKNVRDALNISTDYPDRYPTLEEEFLFRWGMSALFHDVGYPLEIAYESIHEFSSMLMLPNLYCQSGDIVSGKTSRKTKHPILTLKFCNFADFLYINALGPLDKCKEEYLKKYPNFKKNLSNNIIKLLSCKISNCLGIASKKVICQKLGKAIDNGLEQGLLDHGLYSAIIFLKWHNEAFLKSKWNPAYFYIPIVDAATAIFLHNAYDYIFNIPPFNLGALEIKKHPLSFLLILCDKVQEVDRAPYGYANKDINFTDCSVYIDDNAFDLKLSARKGEDKKLAKLRVEEIARSIQNSIDITGVFKKFSIGLKKVS